MTVTPGVGLCPVFMPKMSHISVRRSRNYTLGIPLIALDLHKLTGIPSADWCPPRVDAKGLPGDRQGFRRRHTEGTIYDMTELGRLIQSASRANRGRSMQAAADLATKHGAPISKSHISKSARQVDSLTPQLVRGIAAGYGLSQEDVIRAVLADLGFAISDYNPTIESQIRRDPEISEEAKAILLAATAAARMDGRGVDQSKPFLDTAWKQPAVEPDDLSDRMPRMGQG
jgi:hypothetical protein